MPPGGWLQQPLRRTHGQIGFDGHPGNVADPLDDPGRALPEPDLVAQVDELECGLKQVVAVGATPDDVQEQVQLAGCRPWLDPPEGLAMDRHGRPSATAATRQSSTTTLSRMPPWDAVNLSGRATPPAGLNES